MEKTKFFGEKELSQKIPQQVLSHMYFLHADEMAKPLFLFSQPSSIGVPNCVVSVEDCIVYFHKTFTSLLKIALLYVDMITVTVRKEGKYDYVYIEMNDGRKIKIDIKSDSEEVKKLFEFINNYKEHGATYTKERMCTDQIYTARIAALRKGANFNEQIRKEKLNADFKKMDEKYLGKANTIAASRAHGYYTLQYCGGLGEDIHSGPAKITVNTLDLFMEIAPKGQPSVRLPFNTIYGANVTSNEADLPEDNAKIKPTYYLYVRCTYNGQNTEIVFSNQQDKYAAYDPIDQLQYAITHFSERIQERQARNARYDARAEQLAEEREQIIAKRNAQIERLHQDAHKVTHGDEQSLTDITSSNGSPTDEIRKYKALLDDGIITQEEFDAKKKELLNL